MSKQSSGTCAHRAPEKKSLLGRRNQKVFSAREETFSIFSMAIAPRTKKRGINSVRLERNLGANGGKTRPRQSDHNYEPVYNAKASCRLPHIFFHALGQIFDKMADETLLSQCENGLTQNAVKHNQIIVFTPILLL